MVKKKSNQQIRENYFELPLLAETVDKITGQTLEERWK